MAQTPFPPNSEKSRAHQPPPQEEKKIEPIVTEGTKRRKKPLGKKFKETFFNGDGRSAGEHVLLHILIPAVKETLFEASTGMVERVIFGDSRNRGRGTPRPGQHATGSVQYPYHQMSQRDKPPTAYANTRDRASHNFDEIILDQRGVAEEVLSTLYDVVDQYQQASVADLYGLVGERPNHTDHKWGWTDLRGSAVVKVRGGGYLVDLPRPEPLP